ncbi:hypothetical protein [Mycolicibacterium vanbaalenii]|uniref:Uncharacterized protein n=1 Tax=Mycolicibacterium vanbaalenii (strain DSM 7251 / JCM 13017 / BCRC 16820 / KCTC 9966 / NRRL B-24157 / PYR-1) TaxID=350058 RepID=A1TD90_MYCVP|nr:hypothetical protein [Mycolicibacterium vanbaalenii]ABM15140.1 hypothetical protein Mvan_4363 [Mycolicibacterium vanbaalenii PYR-1]MCV7127019.1 hypothetical protein [Mycolicibacterium vanbaalenii PYR-1]
MTNSTTPARSTNVSASDALKYAAAQARQTANWALDAIAGSCCNSDHEAELDALHSLVDQIEDFATELGDLGRYSDGRLVRSATWIVEGDLSTGHVWHPDVAAEEPRTWRGHLSPACPGAPSPGVYEVTTDPLTQEIHVRVVRTVPEDGDR